MLSPAQTLILDYMKVDSVESLSVTMIQSKLNDLLKSDPIFYSLVMKYSKALTVTSQL